MRVASSGLAQTVFTNLLSIDFSRWPTLDSAEIESVTRKCQNLREVAYGDAADINQRIEVLTCLSNLRSISLSSCPSLGPYIHTTVSPNTQHHQCANTNRSWPHRCDRHPVLVQHVHEPSRSEHSPLRASVLERRATGVKDYHSDQFEYWTGAAYR